MGSHIFPFAHGGVRWETAVTPGSLTSFKTVEQHLCASLKTEVSGSLSSLSLFVLLPEVPLEGKKKITE